MRRIALFMTLGLVAACGGAADEQPPVQPPPPPAVAPPPADTTPPPVAAAPAPAPKPSLADLETAAVADVAANFADSGKVVAHYTPDAVMRIAGAPPATGREAIQTALQGWLDQNSNVAQANAQSWTKGNLVAVHWVTTGTNKATGKPWGIDGVSLYTFNDDGLITKDDTYFDFVTMMKQTGAYKGATIGRAIATLPTGAIEAHMSKGDATEDANVASENALNAAWMKLDDKTALGLFADSAVMNDFTDDQPRDKKYSKEIWVAAKKAMKDPTWKDWNLFGAEDFTIDEGEFTFTQVGDFVHGKVRIPNKKKTVTGHNVEVDQWKDGKIVKSWNWSNEMEMDAQLGIGPAAEKAAPAAPKPQAKKNAAAAKTSK